MIDTTRVIVLGTGGTCVDILETLWDLNDAFGHERYKCVGFLDDDTSRHGTDVHGVPVLGPLSSATRFTGCQFINGIGSPTSYLRKAQIIDRTGLATNRFDTIIHPTAAISRSASVGAGTVILQNVTVASNVTIGAHVVILANSVLNHDSTVGDHSCIAGSVCISGNVRIGRSCYLGAGSVLRNDIAIGDRSLIGMGSVVLRDIAQGSVVAGNPARLLRQV